MGVTTAVPEMQAPILQAPILEARGVNLRFGGVRALTDVSFAVRPGEVFSIIGPNGAGKTSMVNCISGRYRPTEGAIHYNGQDVTRLRPNRRAAIGIGRTFQNLALFGHMTVLDNIMVGRHHLMRRGFLPGMAYWFGGAQREEMEHRRAVEAIIDFLEIQHVRKSIAGTLPYGLRKRVELEPNNPEAHYTLGTYHWDKASRDFRLSDKEKLQLVLDGLDAVNKAIEIKPDYVEAITYKGLLLRTQALVEKDPKKQQQLIREGTELGDKANAMRKAKATS